jgi:hypothetical protein
MGIEPTTRSLGIFLSTVSCPEIPCNLVSTRANAMRNDRKTCSHYRPIPDQRLLSASAAFRMKSG